MGSRRRPRQTPLIAAAYLVAPFLLFAPALDAPFVSDDQNAIVANELVAGPTVNPVAIFSTPSWWGASRADAPGFRPLTTLSFAINRAASGLAVRSFHATNFLLHGTVAWLTSRLAVSLGLGPAGALAAGIVFLLLPIHSEAVIWTVGRAELFAAVGFASGLIAILEYRQCGRTVWLVGAALALLAGLLGKESAVALVAMPPALGLLVPGGLLTRRRDLRLVAALAAALTVYLAIRWHAGIPLGAGDAGDLLDNPLAGLSGLSRALGTLSVLGRYLTLTLWPIPLSIDYSFDALAIREGFAGDFHTVVALLACSLLAVVGWRARKRFPAVPLGLVAAAAAYAVVGNLLFPIGTIMAERLFYLPSLGLSLAAGAAVDRVLANARRVRPSLAVLSIAALGYATVDFTRAIEWRSPVAIFEAAARAYPSSARAQMELASAYGREGRGEEALACFARATAIMPEYAAAWYNRANLLARQGRFAEAEQDYERALQSAPSLVQAWYNLALVRQTLGELPEAVAAMERAAAGAPADPQIRLALADLLLASSRLAEAISAYDAALAAGSEPVATRVNRGVSLQRIHGCDAALPDYLAAVASSPAHPSARANAISCLRELGRMAEAERLAAGSSLETRPAGR